MKTIYSLLLAFFLFTNSAHAYTQQQCMNAMYGYYLYLEKQLDDLAKKQLDTAGETCKDILNDRDQLEAMNLKVIASERLVTLYAKLLDKGLVPKQKKSH